MAEADLFSPVFRAPVAANGRRTPRLWVRRLAIFRDRGTLIRDVSLKPGLNIIWTPGISGDDRQSLAHGSGKTTFCRLLRACLGEPEYASEAGRARIMSKLSEGVVGAEVVIDDVCWVAIRSFGLGVNFAVQMDSIESALARGRHDGDPATLDPIIRETFFSDLRGRTPPEVGDDHTWDVFRAWLSRDQECRLADILAWRSVKTQTRSRAQTLSETAKLTMVRLALGALDAEEQASAARERELVSAAEEQRRRATYSVQRRTERLRELRDGLGVGDDVGLEDTLEQKGLVSLAEARLVEAMRAGVPKAPDIEALLARMQDLGERRETQAENLRKTKNIVDHNDAEAERLRSEAAIGEIEITVNRIRVCPVCRDPIDEVLAEGCRISLDRKPPESIREAIADKQARAAFLEREARAAENEANLISAIIHQISAEQKSIEAAIADARSALKATSKLVTEIKDTVYRARKLLDEARALRDEEEPTTSGVSAVAELESVRAQLGQGRKRAQRAIAAIEERYRAIIAAWLPEGVEGTVELDGKGLKVDTRLVGRGEISTAALESLEIVAFDLSALHLAVEGRAALPPFLIHDSPREADLDEMLYSRLFRLIMRWESESQSPCFQYIITTTTAPPRELESSLIVRLVMNSTPPENRLLKSDL